jgi:hypothetical protein
MDDVIGDGWEAVVMRSLVSGLMNRRAGRNFQRLRSLTVITTGVGLPRDEGEGGVAPTEIGQPAARAEHMHLDGLGREVEGARDLLRPLVPGDQAQDFPFPRRQPSEGEC